MCVQCNSPTSITYYLNGNQTSAFCNTSLAGDPNNQFNVGMGGNSVNLTGTISEIMMFSSARSDANRLTVTNSLMNKWGLSYNSAALLPGLRFGYVSGAYHNDNPVYFDTATFSGVGITNNILNVFNGTGGIFSSSTNALYCIQWFGYFRASVSGTYTFTLGTDDGGMLWVGANALSGYTTSNCLINNSGAHAVQYISNTISLSSGTYYPLRLQQGNSGGTGDCQFSFTPPGGSQTYDGTGYYFASSGSGGGGSMATSNNKEVNVAPGSGTPGQGNNGGVAYYYSAGAGAGGAGAVGGNAANQQGGSGGIGLACAISGTSVYYAARGSGGT